MNALKILENDFWNILGEYVTTEYTRENGEVVTTSCYQLDALEDIEHVLGHYNFRLVKGVDRHLNENQEWEIL